MAEFSEKISEVTGQESELELRQKLKENFDMIQRFIDGITGQRLEDWTAVQRDGSISMSGDLTLDGGSLRLRDQDGIEETSIRLGGGGVLEHRDEVNAPFTSIYDPEYKDVTDSRDFDTVYKNGKKHRMCQITVRLFTASPSATPSATPSASPS